MAKKKELDNLSLDMIRCKKDGFGCHYGAWKVSHENTKDKTEEPVPQGLLTCQYCGKPFKPKTYRKQKFCEYACQYAAARERNLEKDRERCREYQRRKRDERKLKNESCA